MMMEFLKELNKGKTIKGYKYNVGDKVRIKARKNSSLGVIDHDGEVVTIKARCPFTWAYELEELPNLWVEGLLKEVQK